MEITAYKNRQILILSLALGLIFFGFNGAEQHFTAFYQKIGLSNLAFQSLAILYGSIVIGNLIGPWMVNKIGIKTSLILGYLTYVALVFGIVVKNPMLVYILSGLLGVGAGVAGIARIDFLRLVAPITKRGEYAGAQESVRTFGGFLGVVAVSLFLLLLNISQTFILLGSIMLLGTLLLLLLNQIKEIKVSKTQNFQLMSKFLVSSKILLLVPNFVAGGFILGLVLGKIPAVILEDFGIVWVGVITSLFHLTLGIVSVFAGYLSDIKGRFPLIYSSIAVSILGALIFLTSVSLPILALVMVLLGLGGSLGSGAFSALMLDTFERDVKEASAVLGNLAIIFGIVPSFLLPQFLSQNQMFVLAIGLTLFAMICLFIFQKLYYLSNA